jgi:formylglycine-generating enzyme required for sulfatase activity
MERSSACGLFLQTIAALTLACSAAIADDGPASARQAADFAGTKAGQVRADGRLKAKFVWIPAGRFTMGSPVDEIDRRDNETQVTVTITNGFWLGQTEVTQSVWTRVMQTSPWKGRLSVKEGTDYAASYVSWDDAMAFCKRLTQFERNVGELPADWRMTLPT